MNRRRGLALALGLAAAAVPLLPPSAWSASRLLLLHTLQHMLLLVLAAPALAYALHAYAAPRAPDLCRRLGHPIVGLAAFTSVIVCFQAPAVMELAMRHPPVHQAEHLCILLAAVCFWLPIIRPSEPSGLSPIAKVGYLLLAGVPPTIPGVILALSRSPVYATYAASPRLFGLDPLDDQLLAGLLLFASAKLALFAGTFVILWRLLEPGADPPEDDRRPAAGAPGPPSVPAWLELLDGELVNEPAPVKQRTVI